MTVNGNMKILKILIILAFSTFIFDACKNKPAESASDKKDSMTTSGCQNAIMIRLFEILKSCWQENERTHSFWKPSIAVADLQSGDTLILTRTQRDTCGILRFSDKGKFQRSEKRNESIHFNKSYITHFKYVWTEAGTWKLQNGQLSLNYNGRTIIIKMVSHTSAFVRFVVEKADDKTD